jgi:2-iminobutanoate/2-iminopropanoate deaminase
VKIKIDTSKAPQPLVTSKYSQAIVVGNTIYLAGQIHLTPDGKLLEGTIEEQTHQVMKNLKAVLEEIGASFSDVVKTTAYITDRANYRKVVEVYGSYMSEPYPARETVCVSWLPLEAKVEISMIAVKS